MARSKMKQCLILVMLSLIQILYEAIAASEQLLVGSHKSS